LRELTFGKCRVLKNELHRLGRSCSPHKQMISYTEVSPVRRSVPKPSGRSVSPYTPRSRVAKTYHPEEKSNSPVKRLTEKKTPPPPEPKIKEKKVKPRAQVQAQEDEYENLSPWPRPTRDCQIDMMITESNTISEPHSSPQEKQSRGMKDSLKFVNFFIGNYPNNISFAEK